jgi:hypothetical protein
MARFADTDLAPNISAGFYVTCHHIKMSQSTEPAAPSEPCDCPEPLPIAEPALPEAAAIEMLPDDQEDDTDIEDHLPSSEPEPQAPDPVVVIPEEIPDDHQLSQEFNDAAPSQAQEEQPAIIPPFASAGSLSTVLASLRDGNLVLGAVLTQLRELNLRVQSSLEA